jgi:hypothetical protein
VREVTDRTGVARNIVYDLVMELSS